MAPRLKPIKDEKELAAVPLGEPVLVELEPVASGAEPEQRSEPQRRDDDDGVSTLEKQLEASKEAERLANERAAAADRRAQEAAAERDRLRSQGADTEKELLSSSLAGAQAEEAAAQADFQEAFENGDAKAMAAAQAKIGRAAAKVVNLEGAIAAHDDDTKASKERPQIEDQVDIVTAIDRDPKLMATERDWLKAHTEVLTDPSINAELSVGYNRALKAGHRRGTPAYFQYLDEFLGFAESSKGNEPEADERSAIVSAPVTRDSRSSFSGRPATPTRITLTPEQRELARTMNLTDVQYAKGVLQLGANKKSDPERFAGR